VKIAAPLVSAAANLGAGFTGFVEPKVIRSKFTNALKCISTNLGSIPEQDLKYIGRNLARRFVDCSAPGVGYFPRLYSDIAKLEAGDPLEINECIGLLIVAAEARPTGDAIQLAADLQYTQIICFFFALIEEIGSEALCQVLSTIFFDGQNKSAEMLAYSTSIRTSPVLGERPMDDIDDNIIDIFTRLIQREVDSEIIANFTTALSSYLGKSRTDEAKTGNRGRGTIDPAVAAADREKLSAVSLIDNHTVNTTCTAEEILNAHNRVTQGVSREFVTALVSVSRRYGIPGGAAYFEMMSESRMLMVNDPAKWIGIILDDALKTYGASGRQLLSDNEVLALKDLFTQKK
jgi:hypothetical protein